MKISVTPYRREIVTIGSKAYGPGGVVDRGTVFEVAIEAEMRKLAGETSCTIRDQDFRVIAIAKGEVKGMVVLTCEPIAPVNS